MKYFLVFLLFFILPTLAQAETAYERVMRTGVLKCGVNIWPPAWMKDPNTGAYSGLMKDLADHVGSILDLKIEHVEVALGQQIQDLRSGKIDSMCGDGPWVFTSMKYQDYTRPFSYAPIYVYATKNNASKYKTPADLNNENVRFVGIDGDVSVMLVDKIFPAAKLSTLSGSSDPAQMMMHLATGKADVAAIDPVSVEIFNKNNKDKLEMVNLGKPLMVYPVGFSVLKGETELLSTLNDAIGALHNMGSIVEDLLNKYDPSRETSYEVAKPYEVRK